MNAPNVDIPLSFNFLCRFVATGSRPQTLQDLITLASAGVTRIINVCDVADPSLPANANSEHTYWNPTADDGQHGDEKVQWILRSLRWWQANAQPPQAVYCHCFTPDTMIDAPLPRTIDDPRLKEVWGHDGQLHAVTHQLSRHYIGDLIKFNLMGTFPIECTPEHPFLVVRPYRFPSGVCYKPNFRMAQDSAVMRQWFASEPGWLKAHQIREGDFLVAPKPQLPETGTWPESCHKPGANAIPITFPPIDNDVAWLCGLYIADGSTNGENGIGFALGLKKNSARAVNVLRRFGVEPLLSEHGTYRRINVASRTLAANFREWFGSSSREKRIPAFLMNATSAKPLIEGIREGDGCEYRGNTVIHSTSKALIYQLRQLLLALDKYPALSLFKRFSGYPNAAPMYEIRWVESTQHQTFWWNNLYCHRIKSIESAPYDGPVFNLEVADAHTYLANGVVAHNCYDGINRGPSTAYAILLAMGLFSHDAKALIHKYRPATSWMGIRYSDDAEKALELL